MLARASLASRSNERLKERRRSRRRKIGILLLIITVLIVGTVIYSLQQESFRVTHVEVFGESSSLATVVLDSMKGSYFGIIPRDSTFFYPEEKIRSDILAANTDIAAVSIFRKGLTSLSIKVDTRTPIARWCGIIPKEKESCYFFDASGVIYGSAATTSQTLNASNLYAPITGDAENPIHATIEDTDHLPSVFDFARQLGTLGSPVVRIVITNGEVNDYLANSIRITYVLGDEQNAFTALNSSEQGANLKNGSLEYIDLRFQGKVYVKRRSDKVE